MKIFIIFDSRILVWGEYCELLIRKVFMYFIERQATYIIVYYTSRLKFERHLKEKLNLEMKSKEFRLD